MLLGSSVLEVVVGIVLFFLLLAIICTSINEIIARVMRLRASTLVSGIGELLSDPTVEGFAKQVYAHPLITALEKKHRPSYIHGRTFAAAFIDTISQGAASVAEVRAAIVAHPDIPEDLKRQLTIIVNDAGEDIAALRKGVGVWYDDAMERVSGWYKRKTQVVTFFVAAFLVLLLNADSLAIADGLLKNPAAREAFVAQASALVPVGAQGVPETDVEAVKAALEPIGFAMGWSAVGESDLSTWLSRIVGWSITIVAIMLGAPFWFDVLGKVSNLRSAGNPPPSSSSALASGA